ncbi:MAG TPA: ABC transporter ATP-binding protein [Micrococcaceae bacterium]
MNSVIEISDLVKTFGRTRALDGLDLTVRPGEILGFLGPNGSGKSTTIRVLLGLLRADSGRVTLLGGNPWKDGPELHTRIAYVPGDVALWPNLSGGEVIDVIGRFRGGIDKRRRDELIEAFELDPRKKARTYSKGNRQKVGLIAALASEAELYILDEPTSGLDPLMESVFKREVAKLRVNGVSILLSSHILSEVEQLCDRVSIIRAGRTVESGTLAELRHLTRSTVRASVASVASVPAALDGLDGVSGVALDGTKITLQAEAGALDSVMALLARSGLQSLEVHPPTLEELFMSHYSTADGGSDAGPAADSGSDAGPATGGRGGRTRRGRAHPGAHHRGSEPAPAAASDAPAVAPEKNGARS